MRAWECAHAGGLDDLALRERAAPVPGEREVLVRVAAAALNFSDLLMLKGAYQVKPPAPFVPGQEIAGQLLRDAHGFSEGERLASKVHWGGFAELAAARADMLIRLPEDLSFEEGATLPVVWPTAWIALHRRARLCRGETVLVHAAAGGVGAAAVQLARAAGARVIAAARGEAKLAHCRALGADETLDYSEAGWSERVLELTGGAGVEVVFDPVGGEVTELSLKALARGGRLLIVGFSSGTIAALRPNRLLLKNASALGVYWSHEHDAALVEQALEAVFALRREGRIRLLVGRTYAFEDLPQALADLGERRTTGKSVLRIP